MSQFPRTPVVLALGAALAGGLTLSPQAFAMTDLAAGYMLGASTGDKAAEGKCGEGKCGGAKGHTLARMDTNKDGVISTTEFAAAHGGDTSRFARYDADKSGTITQAELDAGHAAKKAAEGKCGAMKTPAAKPAAKMAEGKCGEGKCGGAA